MGFWDFFRKKSEKIENEKVELGEIESWVQNKKIEIKKQEEDFSKIILERISQLVQEFKEEISVLNKINVDERKAEEKIKLIVKENLGNYVYYLKGLLSKLEGIGKEKESREIIENINSVFSDFKKKSSMSYEKATFLIGKEIGRIKESMSNFFRDVDRTIKENQGLIEKSKAISSVEEKLKKRSEIEKMRTEIEKNIKEQEQRAEELNKKIEDKEEEMEKIKKSKKFIENEKKKKEFAEKKEEANRGAERLREMIDFKMLANFFHSFEKEMKIINEHKENFKQAFDKTNGEEIISLLRESKLSSVDVLNKIQEITEKKKEIQGIEIEKTEIDEAEKEIKKIRIEIEVLDSKKLAEQKRDRKLKENLNELISLIKEELAGINAELV